MSARGPGRTRNHATWPDLGLAAVSIGDDTYTCHHVLELEDRVMMADGRGRDRPDKRMEFRAWIQFVEDAGDTRRIIGAGRSQLVRRTIRCPRSLTGVRPWIEGAAIGRGAPRRWIQTQQRQRQAPEVPESMRACRPCRADDGAARRDRNLCAVRVQRQPVPANDVLELHHGVTVKRDVATDRDGYSEEFGPRGAPLQHKADRRIGVVLWSRDPSCGDRYCSRGPPIPCSDIQSSASSNRGVWPAASSHEPSALIPGTMCGCGHRLRGEHPRRG